MSNPIRAQYHFRETERGLCAWDVRRLVSLTQDIDPCIIQLEEIAELDEAYWKTNTGEPLSPRDLVEHMQLIEAADLNYPIIVDPDFRLMDGMHRVCKALLKGHPSIKAIRLETLPDPDYINIAPNDLPYLD